MLPLGTDASVIAMISAERMKSVLMALATFSILERLRLQRYRAQLSFMRMCLMWHDGFEDLFRPLVAEVGTAEHEKRRDHPRDEIAKGQSRGKQEQKLVAK